jgi:GMP synthase (glutamine-hydrolysing)
MQQHDTIAVVDFGGQYAHLIATKVRRNRVLAEIRQPEDPIEAFQGYRGIILSGSPSLSSQGEDSEYTREFFDLDVPILGFCFGHQEIAKRYGGTVIHGGREWGHADLHVVRDHPLFAGLQPVEQVWMSHFDTVASIGPGFEELGWSTLGVDGATHRLAAIGSDSLRRYGFQFHPEVDDTEHGDEMIANFVLRICGCEPSWTMERYVEQQAEKIRAQVGEGSVFLLVSGGVDSTVCARLFGVALGPERLHLLHIDNGLMRKEESARVLQRFTEWGLDSNLHFVDASDTFLGALGDATEPEVKRRIIGNTFIDVFEQQAQQLGIADHLLGQGTIYPDTIETGGTKRAHTIKTHHNRVPIIEEMIAQGRVVEPIAELYKVEVRELGATLGIPHDALWRHPFPGPGLGVRLLCSAGGEVEEDHGVLDDQLAPLAAARGLTARVLPVRSVGVKADLRSYEHPVMLWGDADWDGLHEAAGELLKTVPGINRCVWNLSAKVSSTFEPLAATMTRPRLDLLREADHLVMDGLRRHGGYDDVWQCPVVLLPLRIDGRGEELCVIRPVKSERAMTATAGRLPAELLAELRDSIGALEGISGVAVDLTSKPPGTIEWE